MPYDEFNVIPESTGSTESEEDTDEDDENEETDVESLVPAQVMTIFADDLVTKINKVSQGLYLYNSYYKIYRSIDKGNLVFSESNKVFT